MKKCLFAILILTVVGGLFGCGKEPVGDPPIVNEGEYFYVEGEAPELSDMEDEGL